LSHYRSILKDQSAIAHAEKVLADFKAVDYDVSKWNDAVSAFESKAVSLRWGSGTIGEGVLDSRGV